MMKGQWGRKRQVELGRGWLTERAVGFPWLLNKACLVAYRISVKWLFKPVVFEGYITFCLNTLRDKF